MINTVLIQYRLPFQRDNPVRSLTPIKGETLDKHTDRLYIYTILPGNLPFKKADWLPVGFLRSKALSSIPIIKTVASTLEPKVVSF